MTDIMAYQYPPPPPNGAEMDMPPSGYISNYTTSSPMEVRPTQDSVLSLKERKTLSKVMKLKRSISTPNVRPQHQAPPPLPTTPQTATSGGDPSNVAMSAEKRRNKLGYHRTSVACGHCRRRKIRCIPSPSDLQGRCVNCIRLKKECSFFPVDQQPPTAAASKAVPRSSTGPKIVSASSSPAMQHPSDPYQNMNMPPIQTMPPPMKPPGSEGYSADGKCKFAPISSPAPTTASHNLHEPLSCQLSSQECPDEGPEVPLSAASYGHPLTNWMADASPNTSKPGDINTAWRGYPNESPVSQSFSPYTPHAPPQSATWGTPVGPESGNREDMGWSSYPPPPARSMSFGGEPTQYPSRGYDRKSSTMSNDMYPAPIATSMPSMETIPGAALDQHVSLSAGSGPTPTYAAWQQQTYGYTKPGDPYGAWYENGGSAQLGSDDGVAPGNENQVPGAGMYQYATGR